MTNAELFDRPRPLTDEEVASLNPNIRETVQRLRSVGFHTVDSGDGETHEFECDLPIPYVHIRVPEKFIYESVETLMALLTRWGVSLSSGLQENDPHIVATYNPLDAGGAIVSVLNVHDRLLKEPK